jgi:hypothetical protein
MLLCLPSRLGQPQAAEDVELMLDQIVQEE